MITPTNAPLYSPSYWDRLIAELSADDICAIPSQLVDDAAVVGSEETGRSYGACTIMARAAVDRFLANGN